MSAPAFQLDSRERNVEQLARESFDVLIIGGGINGAGVARDLMLRARQNNVDLRVALIEKNHFASGTSGKNSQLIHGGLRYLKNLEFGLVRESLRERATLLRIAPQLVHPQAFLIPAYSRFDRLVYRTGLWLYDELAGSHKIGPHRALSKSEVLMLEPELAGEGLRGGLLFHDARVNSARLVLENIFDAARLGAVVANYVEVVERGHARDRLSDQAFMIRARRVVDATGAWSNAGSLRLVRGSHIIIPRVNRGDEAIAYFEPSGRIIFVIPWGTANDLSLVGTTDVDHNGSPDDVRISRQEFDYLAGIVRRLFPSAKAGEPISTYSSLRPLAGHRAGSATKASREHRIWEAADGVLHIAGGKYTTYRAMSEEAVDHLCREIAPSLVGKCSTADTPLGGNGSVDVRVAVEHEMARHLSDVLYISTYWGYERKWTAQALASLAREMGALLGWSEGRISEEIRAVL